jgi:DNA ligase-1
MQSSPIQSFPTLYKTTAGSTRVWIARIITATATYETEHGSFGGKMQLTQRVFTEGKNIGKKNETTPLQQCTAEITKKWADKKAKEGYVEGDQSPAVEPVLTSGLRPVYPMLAQTYDPVTNAGKKAGIKFPCYVQPKLDGLRCIMYCDKGGRVSVQSRTGGQFTTLDHIVSELGPYLAANPGLVLDGELYTDEIPFETLVGHIKRKKVDPAMLPEIRKIRYHVYDIIDDNKKTFVERLAVLASVPLVQQVDTVLVQTPEEVKTKFAEYVAAGYEGIMLRNTTGMYKQNGRSTDLQKYKEFQEAEYTITGFTQGEGRDAGAVIWTCSTDGNKQFSVRPRGTIEDRRALFIDGAQHIGKQLTVVFQELSEQNVPRFPVGKGIRDGY